MKNQELQDNLRIAIKDELAKVSKANSPHVWTAMHTPKGELNISGYRRIESMVIKKIVSGQVTPAAAIPQIEMEFDLL